MRSAPLLLLLAILLPAALPSVPVEASTPVRVFTQCATAYAPDGRALPVVDLVPGRDAALCDYAYDLGDGRRLCIRTDLPPARLGGLDDAAARVVRAYDHVETATGRPVPGDVLLYLMAVSPRPDAYRFRAEVDADAPWSQIRLALIDAGETLSGPGESPHLRELLLDTLPHELGHTVLSHEPTVREDLDGGPPTGTRWFVDGVCESLAKGFALREDPAAARALARQRRLDDVMDRDGVRAGLLAWHSGSALSWELESDLYGAALLLVRVWEEALPLPALLDGLAADGGDHDGGTLLDRLRADTGLSTLEAMDRAADLGRALAAPSGPGLTWRTKKDDPPSGGPPLLSSAGLTP